MNYVEHEGSRARLTAAHLPDAPRRNREILEAHIEWEIAIVTHGGVARLVIGSILGVLPRSLLRLSQGFGCMNVIDVRDGLPSITIMNYVPCAGACHFSDGPDPPVKSGDLAY